MFDIIIPIYRIAPALLKRCIDSVFAQSLSDTEYNVWVVDGTPLDADTYAGCMQIVEEYDDHPRFNYFRQSGSGVSQARNEAVTLGSSPFIAWLDGDDYWYPLHLEELHNCIKKTTDDHVVWWNAGDVTTSTTGVNGYVHRTTHNFNYFPNHSTWSDRYHGLHFRLDATVFPSSVVVRRSRFEEVGGFLEEVWLGEDQLLWYYLCGDGRRDDKVYLSYQNDFVGIYRQHDENYFEKGQNPWQDLYGDEARHHCDAGLKQNYLKYWGPIEDWEQPADMSDQEWKDITTWTFSASTENRPMDIKID